MTKDTLGKRLSTVAKFVRQGAVFADIGTDHAHLPIYLLKSGRISRAVCSDVNQGPLSRAMENAVASGVTQNISFRLCDGAAELFSEGITDMAICGMGGELIARIIEDAPYLKDSRVRLILQPMSRAEHLCKKLYDAGFSVLREAYAEEGGKYYRITVAQYAGALPEKTLPEIEIGLPEPEYRECQIGYLKARRASLTRALNGMKIAGESTKKEAIYIDYIDKMIIKLDKKQENPI